MKILDGKQTALKISARLKEEISGFLNQRKRAPKIDIILVGDDYASKMYVDMKSKKAVDLGIDVKVHSLGENTTTGELENILDKLNQDTRVDGIMVQLPLPKQIDEKRILELISPTKDVDGLTSYNLGKLFKNDNSAIAPATAKGVILLLKEYNIQIDGKNVVVIGRGDIAGLPIAAMLQNENATVTICHSHTQNLREICKDADILVSSIGKPEYINSEYVKEGSIVIDVGTNRNTDGKLVGDIDFNSVENLVEYITPVPGGVGPMTIACLFDNLIDVYRKNV